MIKYNSTIELNLKSQNKKGEDTILSRNLNLMKDLSYHLSIIKTSNISQIVLDALKELEDNTYKQFKQHLKQSIMTFNVLHQNPQNSSLCQYIKLLCQGIPFNHLYDKLKQIEDIQQLQLNQQITNALLFQFYQKEFQNEFYQSILFYSLYSQKILCRTYNCLFINLSGHNRIEQDLQILTQLNQLKEQNMDMYYISFHKIEQQAKQNKKFKIEQFQQFFLNDQGQLIRWPQLKSYLKPILKKKIQLFNPDVCVLQLFVSLDNKIEIPEEGLQLENDCVLKIVHFFQKISKDKLLINLLIKNSEQNTEESNEQKKMQEQEEQSKINKKVQLKQMINAIQQGIIGKIKAEIVDKRSNSQIFIDYNYQLSQSKNRMYQVEMQRILNNQICQQKLEIENNAEIQYWEYQYIPFIDNNKSLQFFQFYINLNRIQINNSTQIFFKQKEKIAIIFQVQEFKLYYCKIECKCVKKECHLLNLQDYQKFNNIKNDEFVKAPIIAIIEDKIYLNYGYLGDQIWEFDIITQKVKFLKRVGLQNQKNIQDAGEQQRYILEREGGSVFYNLMENQQFQHYFIAGGELGSNSPICNIIERVFPGNESFYSGFIDKSLFKVSLKPFKYSLFLQNNQSVIFLPGDYNKKRYKYSQVINHQHYEYAQRLSIVKNQWMIENIKIVYENEELGNLYPIHQMPNNQQIVYNFENDYWIVCYFGLQLQQVGSTKLFSQQILRDEINQNEFHYQNCNTNNKSNLCQVIIKMEIKYYQDQLFIQIIPMQIGRDSSIIRNTFQFQKDQ